MLERQVQITNALGLHARAAAQLVRAAARFRSRIILIRMDNGESANAKSILSVLHLAAGHGVTLTITADGDDEDAAIETLEAMFLQGFGEN